MASSERTYPLRKPKNHTPPIPRWQLVLGSDINYVYTSYIGVQQHSKTVNSGDARLKAVEGVKSWLESANGPLASERFALLDGNDVKEVDIWVCYWQSKELDQRGLDIGSIYSSLPESGRDSIGIWQEGFPSARSRLETNYSGLDYLPGLARLPNTATDEHQLSAYWGAARDRIPDSAHDLFPKVETVSPQTTPRGLGQHLVGTNAQNVVHIRSGQFWENCDAIEGAAYEEKLEPTLRNGLQYLWDNPVENGVMGLRYLVNQDANAKEADFSRKESCGAGFFANLENLEEWAKTHRSHLAIFRGALAHAKTFGNERKFRTWHEISVLGEGDASFEYINCLPETGVIKHVRLEEKK